MKIGWILSGTIGIPTARLHGFNIHNYLLAQGAESKILYAPSESSRVSCKDKMYEVQRFLSLSKEEIDDIVSENYDVIVLQKIKEGNNLGYLVTQAHKVKTKIVYIAVDEINIELASQADGIVLVNDFFKTVIDPKDLCKIYLFDDYYEHDATLHKVTGKSHELRLVYVGSKTLSKLPQIPHLPENTSITIIGPAKKYWERYNPDTPRWCETPFPYSFVEWNLDTVANEILRCDVGVVPFTDESLVENNSASVKVKSINRPLIFMSLGMPVIVSPVPTYTSFIKHGLTGFIARTPDEWIKYIERLRDDEVLRKSVGENARAYVVNKYSKKTQLDNFCIWLRKLSESVVSLM